jgi:uncharacterized protein with PQ loop repeat
MLPVKDVVGWFSAGALMATLVAQIVTQWRDRTSKGVSRWLFIGQLTASVGFIAYSTLVNNTVFIVTNVLIAAVSLFGQYTYYRNRRTTKR